MLQRQGLRKNDRRRPCRTRTLEALEALEGQKARRPEGHARSCTSGHNLPPPPLVYKVSERRSFLQCSEQANLSSCRPVVLSPRCARLGDLAGDLTSSTFKWSTKLGVMVLLPRLLSAVPSPLACPDLPLSPTASSGFYSTAGRLDSALCNGGTHIFPATPPSVCGAWRYRNILGEIKNTC
jgi:hypothetical protein